MRAIVSAENLGAAYLLFSSRLPPPVPTEQLAMPAQERVRLDDQQGLLPGPDATGEQHQERPIGRCATRALDAAPQYEELAAQEGILGEEGGPTAHEVGERARRNRRFGGSRRGEQALPKRAGEGSSELGTTAEEASQHREAPHRVQAAQDRHTPVTHCRRVPLPLDTSMWRSARTDIPNGQHTGTWPVFSAIGRGGRRGSSSCA